MYSGTGIQEYISKIQVCISEHLCWTKEISSKMSNSDTNQTLSNLWGGGKDKTYLKRWSWGRALVIAARCTNVTRKGIIAARCFGGEQYWRCGT